MASDEMQWLGSVSNFDASLRDWIERELPKHERKMCRRIVTALLHNLVEATPIQTGHARGGWQVLEAGEEALSLPKDDEAGWVQSGDEAVRNQKSMIKAIENWEGVSVANPVEYIQKLEDGSSQQAPQGIVRQAVALTIAETDIDYEAVQDIP